MLQNTRVKAQTAPQALIDEALNKTAGGAWHELVILGDVAAAKAGATGAGPHVKVFDGRGG